jgi:hypothetical protein
MKFEKGDRVRIDIPDETDPDFEGYHGGCGTIIATIEDDANELTGDDRNNVLYRVEFEVGKQYDFRWRNLRPVTE